jgi:hypothetical protein
LISRSEANPKPEVTGFKKGGDPDMKKPMMLISGWALLLTVALTGNAQAMATPCEALKYTVTNSFAQAWYYGLCTFNDGVNFKRCGN